jgi:hypothetical protein
MRPDPPNRASASTACAKWCAASRRRPSAARRSLMLALYPRRVKIGSWRRWLGERLFSVRVLETPPEDFCIGLTREPWVLL